MQNRLTICATKTMKISYNWLKEYLPIDLEPKRLAEIFTDIGLEVESVDEYQNIKGGLEGLVVGFVKEVKKHPNADKLTVTKVNVGGENDLQIVCGAPNVAAGQKVIVAQIGTEIFPINGEKVKMKKAKIREVESEGMICAEDEIGLGEAHDGILVLPENAEVGQPAKKYFDVQHDWIFEIGLTPNRSDAMSHYGVARDLFAYLQCNTDIKSALKFPSVEKFKIDNHNFKIDVSVKNAEACPRYSGITITNVRIAESPKWLQNKLKAIGIRPINNVVDITNFILYEIGQPLHAFDADEIVGKKVIVKTLPEGSKFKTLDEKERTLTKNDLMICNEKEGMCIAGVLGGIKSGVKENTKNIFLESAFFAPKFISRTSRYHELRTDAAARFEKGTDPNITVYALKRAAILISEICGGKISSEIIDVCPKNIEDKNVAVSFSSINRLIGDNLEVGLMKNILTALGMKILSEKNETAVISVPAYKHDVGREADIAEEVLRIYGLNKIPIPAQLHSSVSFTQKPDKEKIQNNISDYLSSNGFNEIFCNSISKSTYYTSVGTPHAVSLQNPSNVELDILRPTMLYSGLEAVAYNQNRKNTDLKFYEFGKTYQNGTKDDFLEKQHLSLFVTGRKKEENWKGENAKVDFYFLKSIVKNVLLKAGIHSFEEENIQNENLPTGQKYVRGKQAIVEFGKVQKKILKKMDIKQDVFFADFDWDVILSFVKNQKIKFKEIPKFPSVRRDLALVIDKAVQYAEVEKIAFSTEKKLLKGVNLFDVYEDEKLGANKKSYAVSFHFLDESKTLTDNEVDKIMDKLMTNYEKQIGAVIRK